MQHNNHFVTYKTLSQILQGIHHKKIRQYFLLNNSNCINCGVLHSISLLKLQENIYNVDLKKSCFVHLFFQVKRNKEKPLEQILFFFTIIFKTTEVQHFSYEESKRHENINICCNQIILIIQQKESKSITNLSLTEKDSCSINKPPNKRRISWIVNNQKENRNKKK